jgi:hypothetical protein
LDALARNRLLRAHPMPLGPELRWLDREGPNFDRPRACSGSEAMIVLLKKLTA